MLCVDFNYQGGLNSVLSSMWDGICRNDGLFGCRPNCAVIDDETNMKICSGIINGLLNVDILHDLMLILCWTMTKVF